MTAVLAWLKCRWLTESPAKTASVAAAVRRPVAEPRWK